MWATAIILRYFHRSTFTYLVCLLTSCGIELGGGAGGILPRIHNMRHSRQHRAEQNGQKRERTRGGRSVSEARAPVRRAHVRVHVLCVISILHRMLVSGSWMVAGRLSTHFDPALYPPVTYIELSAVLCRAICPA